jgi:hypothetical protein
MACNYYVYALINPIDNTAFYIGKGKGDRMYQHLLNSEVVNDIKLSKIKEIREQGYEPYPVKIIDNIPEILAYKNEAYLINTIENLTNLQIPKNNGKLLIEYKIEEPIRIENVLGYES